VIDFADTLIRASIEKGYREAMDEVRHGKTLLTGQPNFRKELGEPLFWDVKKLGYPSEKATARYRTAFLNHTRHRKTTASASMGA